MSGESGSQGLRGEIAFLRRVLIVLGVVVLALFLWMVRDALLLVFAAVLIALLVRAAADGLEHWVRVPPRWSVLAACLAIFLPLLLMLVLIGSEVRTQAQTLFESLPKAADTLQDRFGIRIPVPGSPGPQPPPDSGGVGAAAQYLATAALMAANGLGALVIAVIGGIFIAADPAVYRRGMVRLLPRGQQERVEEALEASGKALTLWLKAQLMVMAAVGVMTGLGAWAIGLPAPLALGLFAGLADIVPMIGPFVGAVPGLLLGLNGGFDTFMWTAGMYLVVQQIEGNVLSPILGERMVNIPPALLLFSVVAAGAVFGLGGVLLAAPLTVLVVVLVGKLYVRETLGRPVEVPGEAEPDKPAKV